MSQQPADLDQSAWFITSGPLTFLRNVAQPFVEEVASVVPDSIDGTEIPTDLFPPSRGPTNALFGPALLVGYASVVGIAIGAWAVTRICDAVYDAKIKPALSNLYNRLMGEEAAWAPSSDQPVRIEFGVWYGPSNLFVDVIAEIESLNELKKLDQLIPQAHKAAWSWIQKNGVKDRVLTFKIRDGKVSKQPTWSKVAQDHSVRTPSI